MIGALAAGGAAGGQAVGDPWQATAQAWAVNLAAEPARATRELGAADVALLGGGPVLSAAELSARFAGLTPVAAAAFRYGDGGVPARLAEAAAANAAVPEAVALLLEPRDAAAADYALGRWLTEELAVVEGDLVAVAVFWGQSRGDARPTLHFALTLARPTAAGDYRPTLVRAGAAADAMR